MNKLNKTVLVLNKCWQAVNTCSVKRALTLLVDGRAEVVQELDGGGSFQTYKFNEWCDFSRDNHGDGINGVTFRIRLPRVIMLLCYDKIPKKELKLTRNNLYCRDKDTCQYCGEHFPRIDLNLDHVIPRDQGGKSTWENLVCSCIDCNTRKANRTPEQAHMKLLRKPAKPKWTPFLHLTFGITPEQEWNHFVDVSYWNTELVK
jgi:5-methylcytosine-specific restriction endonuclease McrA